MTNIAQVINVLQSVILTKDEKMVLTPTYYAFKMYKVHMDANLLPSKVTCEKVTKGDITIPAISVSASKDDKGLIHVTMTNLDPEKSKQVSCQIEGIKKAVFKKGEIITAQKMNAFNDFGKPEEISLKEFKDVKVKDNTLSIDLPAKSAVMIELQ
jgi:alpha-N-arabinofuranosidase